MACLALALAGCGLSVAGSGVFGAGPGDGTAQDAAVGDGAQGEDAPPVDVDGAAGDAPPVGSSDAAPRSDAAAADTGTPPPDPTKISLSYAAGKDGKVYQFDIVSSTFSVFASNGCPSAEETAVMTDGSIFVTSSDNKNLYRVTPGTCTAIKLNGNFPFAFGTAPAGTLATTEALVGYTNGDYVRVDPANGNVTTISAGVLGSLRPSGDMTAIGARGFLAAQTGTGNGAFACPAGGDCIVEVSLVSGAPIKLMTQHVGLGIYGLAHSHGNLLFYANSQVFPYDPIAQTLGGAIAGWPAGASFSGAGAAPFPPS